MIRNTFIKAFLCAIFCGSCFGSEVVELFPADHKQWKQSGPGKFSVENDIATSEGGMGMMWYAGKSYGNATFDVEFKLPNPKWNSGIFVRFPDPGNDPWVAVRKGYECQLSGDKAGKKDTGSIYNIQAPSHNSLKKAGEWNSYQITTWEDKIIIVINGELVNVFTTQRGRGDKEGHIGLQNHDPTSRVSFRKVTVREWDVKQTLDEVLEKLGVSRADWAKYHAAKNPNAKWYEKMDIGPVWANVFEDHYDGVRRVGALKGLLLELSASESMLGLFDTETLRMSSAHRGGIYFSGTPWTGAHGGINRLANDSGRIMQTSLQSGWADKSGSFADKRRIKGYGNLDADHGRFRGFFRYGGRTILDYSVHGSRVLEMPYGDVVSGLPVVHRQMDLAASKSDRILLVADGAGAKVEIDESGTFAKISSSSRDDGKVVPEALPGKVSVVVDKTDGDWSELSMGGPSADDTVDRSKNDKTFFRVIPGFLQTHKKGGDEEGVAVRLNDGLGAGHGKDIDRSFFFEGKEGLGRLELNLGELQDVSRIHVYSSHVGERAPQKVEIYGAVKDTADAAYKGRKLAWRGWKLITRFDTSGMGPGGKHGVAVVAPEGKTLGKFHKLLFVCSSGKSGGGSHTLFSEVDVYSSKAPALKPLSFVEDHYVYVKGDGLKFGKSDGGALTLTIPAKGDSTMLSLAYSSGVQGSADHVKKVLDSTVPVPRELVSLTKGGGKALYPDEVLAQASLGDDKGAWAVDTIGLPVVNPWFSKIKPGGLDLFSDGDSAALSMWNGDVWVVKGLKGKWGDVRWRRFATGLYEPLGLKIVNDVVYVNGRDQITRLHDLDGDGEADWYECFNNDVYVTSNFHEFTFGLQTDKNGDFYIVKGAPVRGGGRGFDRILPHNGTMMKISKDGKKMEVMATGLRAPGGLGIGPNGEMTTGENEGSWQPRCKLNYFTEKDKFLGVEPAAHALKGQEMHLPLCYFPMSVDNSGGGQAWVPDGVDWGLKSGELLHLSYGKSSIYRVLRQEVDGVMQGGVVRVPVRLNSSAMRARFQSDGSLYTLGFRGWQTNAATEQAFHRVRYTGGEVTIPDRLEVTKKGIFIRFEKGLDAETVNDKFSFKLERWKYIRSSMYGSGDFSIDNPDLKAEEQATKQESQKYRKRDKVEVVKSTLLEDGKTVFLEIPSIKPADQMSLSYKLKFADGSKAAGDIYHTVHKLGAHEDGITLRSSDEGATVPKNLVPGLRQTIEVGDKIDQRVARLAAEYTSSKDAVSDMLKGNEAYISTWSGFLDLEDRDTFEFSFHGEGEVKLSINGEVILEEKGKLGAKVSSPLRLNPGKHRFKMVYRGGNDGSGNVRLMWKGSEFSRQSVGSSYFKHESTEELKKFMALRHGRDVMAKQNCVSCHKSEEALHFPELGDKGPDMVGIGSRVSEKWLAQWLVSPHTVKPGTTMPAVVDGSTKEGKKDAADMAAYLASLKVEAKRGKALNVGAADVKLGGAHFHKLGCVACHSLPDKGYDAESGRVALNRISEKYSQVSLAAFLVQPDKHHASIKMPDFGLSGDEAGQIAAFLRAESEGKAPKAMKLPAGDAVRGAKLVARHQCSSCHSGLPDENAKLMSFEEIFSKPWSEHGCVSTTHKAVAKSPVLNLSAKDRVLLEGYRKHYENGAVSTFRSVSSHDFAQRQVKALNCVACHQRDDLPSLLESLHSQSGHLAKGVPVDEHHKVDQSRPSLTHVGEMLHTDYVRQMLDGTLDRRPRPWLAMRMPAFRSRAVLLSEGLAAQHGMTPMLPASKKLDVDLAKKGLKLLGADGGFACTICHANGKDKATAAFEVEGINFDQVARRLRTGYYHRWMENPQRITPTTKMPRYTIDNKSPLPAFNNDAKKQFDAMMEYLKSIK